MNQLNSPLVFAHIGDLHLTREREQNHIDFLSIASQLATQFGKELDFVLLPGDNADNGKPSQYALIATALRMLEVPVFLLSGDHDMEQGSLQPMYALPTAVKLPFAKMIKGYQCLFLDICGSGKGGPDFRLGAEQLAWLEKKFDESTEHSHPILLFMHAYPDDLKDEQEKRFLKEWIRMHDVVLVGMGHTHYNEIANDGKTIYTATRSTGQIEEGPVGYSIATIDQGVVSWRFKALADPFPFVIITYPSDYRLARAKNPMDHAISEVRVLIFGAEPPREVKLHIAEQQIETTQVFPGRRYYIARLPPQDLTPLTLTVRAIDSRGYPGLHTIVSSNGKPISVLMDNTGSDRCSIGAWPDNGIPGTQLGPNRNTKPKN